MRAAVYTELLSDRFEVVIRHAHFQPTLIFEWVEATTFTVRYIQHSTGPQRYKGNGVNLNQGGTEDYEFVDTSDVPESRL